MRNSNLSIRGIYRDVVEDGERVVVHDSGWISNTIVTRCRVLLASFMKNEPASGIHHLAVGQGKEAWDSDGPPVPVPKTSKLVQGYKPWIGVDDLEVVYLDASDDVLDTPSPRLQITATLEPGYPPPLDDLSPYPLREFGLFGRLGDEDSGEDYMINCIRHPVIHKDAAATLIRVVRLYF